MKKKEKHHREHHHHPHRRRRPLLFVFLFAIEQQPLDREGRIDFELHGFQLHGKWSMEDLISGEGVSFRMITQIFSNDTKLGAFVTIAEADPVTGLSVQSSGPFAIQVDDPNSLVNVTPGSADNTTPTRITANGNGGVGSVTVTVTDKSNNAVGKASLAVVAPTGQVPTPTLTVGFDAGT